ncbi:hypothetical protein PYCC9005_001245 [Savitreella phatthalungensis]
MAIEVGKPFPNAQFPYVEYSPETGDDVTACGIPAPLDTAKEFAGKTVVIVAAPGAFTPTCQANHIPPFVKQIKEFKSKGADLVCFLTANDPFVNSAWGKANGVKGDILMLSDPNAQWSQDNNVALDLTSRGLGWRTGRWGLIVKDGKVTYFEQEKNPAGQPEVSDASTLLSKL